MRPITVLFPEILMPLIGMSCMTALYFLICWFCRWRSGVPERCQQMIRHTTSLLHRIPTIAVRVIGTKGRDGMRLELRVEVNPAKDLKKTFDNPV